MSFWIKMRHDLEDDPAVIAIAESTGIDEFGVLGRLHALWSWADRQSQDGHAPRVTSGWIDRRVRHAGFAQAMIDVGWLVADESGITIPNFERHNSESAKERALAAERKRKQRGKGGDVTGGDDDESRSERDGGVTRLDKSRSDTEEGEKRARNEYPPEFEAVWDAYPARPGANKRDAFKAWSARLNAKDETRATAEEMLAGAKAYRAFCLARKTEPQYIKQPATFFGPSCHFRTEWAVPAGKAGSHDLGGQDYRAGIGDEGQIL